MEAQKNPSPGFRDHPEHKITVQPYQGHVRVEASGEIVASSDKALVLKEHTYPPVIYIPFSDIDFSRLAPSETSSHCPFKGDATYWNVKGGAKDAMWAYQHPFDEMTGIKDHGAFYPDRVNLKTDA